MRLRKLIPESFMLDGGLDMASIPAMAKPGRLISARNFEPDTNGGYRRIAGIERFDGRTRPSTVDYTVIEGTVLGPLVVGDIITGVTSGAIGQVIAIVSATQFVATVVGTFVAETYNVGGSPYGVITTTQVDGAGDMSLHAEYKALAADVYRGDITTVPGSGSCRGVLYYLDKVYAFRDNAAATACVMHEATTSGWSAVSFGKELQFDAAVGEIFDDDIVVGLTSGATGTVKRSLLRTGTWSVNGVGTLVFDAISGTFQDNEAIQVDGATKVTANGVATNITLLPGGKFEFKLLNFNGADGVERIYCADGVNLLGEWDGTRWVPIRTGAATDTPKFVTGFKQHLVIGMGSSVMTSGTTTPYTWTVLAGASELATGQTITGLVTEVGDDQSGAMLVLTEDKAFVLYGNDTSDFNLVEHSPNSGGRAYTAQNLGITHYLNARGITQIIASQAFGNFQIAVLSNDIQTLIDQKFGLELTSCVLKGSNQYRLFFSDGTGIIGKVVQGQTSATLKNYLPFDYGTDKVMNTVYSATGSDGVERIFGAATNGYIYELERGTSLDGNAMPFHIMTHFHNSGSLRLRKNYHRTIVQLEAESFAEMQLGYSLSYGKSGISQTLQQSADVIGGGSFWNQITDYAQVWGSPYVQEINFKTPGNGNSISIVIAGSSSKSGRFTLQTCTPFYKPNRLER